MCVYFVFVVDGSVDSQSLCSHVRDSQIMADPKASTVPRPNVHFEKDEHEDSDDGEEGYEFSYPDLEHMCWHGLPGMGGTDDDDAKTTSSVSSKMSAATACAQRAAEAAAAGSRIVDKSNLRSARKNTSSPTGDKPKPTHKGRTQTFAPTAAAKNRPRGPRPLEPGGFVDRFGGKFGPLARGRRC